MAARLGRIRVELAVRFRSIFFALSSALGAACASPAPPPSPGPAPPPTEPALVKPAPRAEPEARPEPPVTLPKLSSPWVWVMSVDHGVRNDAAGEGGFLAPRYHGAHNGLDMLAPLGEAVIAPCSGKATTGVSRSFGIWVHLVCPLPKELRGNEDQRASLFFSHLKHAAWKGDDLRNVNRGETIGAVGKTGNAAGPSVASHLHLELIFHDDEEAALAETHSGRKQNDTNAAHSLAKLIDTRCLEPNGFKRREGASFRARRADPFLALSCFTAEKPAYERPKGSLAKASAPWSHYYSASRFDVDAGRQTVVTAAVASSD